MGLQFSDVSLAFSIQEIVDDVESANEGEMKPYATAFVIGGVLIPIFLHVVASESMPWWPDTVSMGFAFGAAALAIVWKSRKDRETRHRLGNAVRSVGQAIGRNRTSN